MCVNDVIICIFAVPLVLPFMKSWKAVVLSVLPLPAPYFAGCPSDKILSGVGQQR